MRLYKKDGEIYVKHSPSLSEKVSEIECEEWLEYFEGYKKAAIRLIDNSFTDPKEFQTEEYIVYPILYIYRHMIELGLKLILYDIEQTYGEKDLVKFDHSLVDRWNEVKKRAEKYLTEKFGSNNSKGIDKPFRNLEEMLDNIETEVNFVNNLDFKGMNFRYPVNKKRKKSIDKEFNFSIVQLRQKIKMTHDLLSEIYMEILMPE